MTDLTSMDSNQVINKLDELLSSGHTIEEIVATLDNVLLVVNYNLLISKGATGINLALLQDAVHPRVVMNNLEVFQNNNIPIDMAKLVSRMDEDDYEVSGLHDHDVVEWLRLGVDPQKLADKYLLSNGYDYEVIRVFIDAGAKIETERYIDNMKQYDSEFSLDNPASSFFHESIRTLRRAGASEKVIKEFEQWAAGYEHEQEIAQYGGTYPKQLDINEIGKQTKKIFFKPIISVRSGNSGWQLECDWAGRILPGQTLREGIATELKAVYDYSGKFEFQDVRFQDYAKDNEGDTIQRYSVYITLLPEK